MAGRKISRQNMARIQQIADHAYAMGAKAPPPDTTPIGKAEQSLGEQMQAVYAAVAMAATGAEYLYVEEVFDASVIVEMGERYFKAEYTRADDGAVTLAPRDQWVEVEEVWQPVQATAKAGLHMDAASDATPYASIKALADRHLEVKVAYYGHKGGKDAHGEYFSANTDFDPENFPAPPLLYYHGYTEQNTKAAKPIVTGKFVSRRIGGDGHYLTYKLKSGKYADLQWDAAQKGQCVVSPGTVGHLIRKASDGELLYWPLAEVSAWDYSEKRKPANLHSVAAPVLKALYIEEGLTLPKPITSESSEALGDSASTGAHGSDIPLDQAAPVIAKEVVHTLLQLRKRTA